MWNSGMGKVRLDSSKKIIYSIQVILWEDYPAYTHQHSCLHPSTLLHAPALVAPISTPCTHQHSCLHPSALLHESHLLPTPINILPAMNTPACHQTPSIQKSPLSNPPPSYSILDPKTLFLDPKNE